MDKMILLILLWGTIYIVSEPQRRAFREFIDGLCETYKRRKLLKNTIRIYNRLYENTGSDYLRGFYYGKSGQLKVELSEVRYFGGDE